jgi:hypothetical protein
VYLGEMRPADGSYYSRLERNQYYAREVESGKDKKAHIAKTPLHIARWAVQEYTDPGDWVLDPTIGSGTTAVEAMTQGRSAAGMELEYPHVVRANVEKVLATAKNGVKCEVGHGDARNIAPFLREVGKRYTLMVNNPPYSGDVSMPSPAKEGRGKEFRHLETRFDYDKELPNIAFLREGQEYWDTMSDIYRACLKHVEPGGHVVIGIKDMMRNRQPFLLHQMFADMLTRVLGLEYVSMVLLKHYPATLHLNTYEQRFGAKPPKYQTVTSFKVPQRMRPPPATEAEAAGQGGG